MSKLFPLLLFLTACTQRNSLPAQGGSFDNQVGQIQVFVCSRGCFQYLVKTSDAMYAPVNLPPEYQSDQSAFIFSGVLQADSTMINKPGADDRPLPDFKVRNLKITQIRPK